MLMRKAEVSKVGKPWMVVLLLLRAEEDEKSLLGNGTPMPPLGLHSRAAAAVGFNGTPVTC